MKSRKTIVAILGLGVLMLAAAGCEQQAGEGPAERAGKELDKAIHDAGRKVEELGEEMQEAADEARQPSPEQQ